MKLEVKVNDRGFLIDDTMEVKDGLMIVTPVKALSKEEVKEEVKEVFNPQDGDIVAVKDGKHVFINKEYKGNRIGYVYIGWNFDNGTKFYEGLWDYSRYATEEEKNNLFRALADNGLEWDAEKRKLVKLSWVPKNGEKFFFPSFVGCRFKGRCITKSDNINIKEWSEYTKGWIFRTAEECQDLCNELNAAINAVTP